ncbi:phage holin family protein [Ovoidimarina sediminis]|uniref:phage holin family protein n=1 Tax=Ovoidimarina sediminis TaxID=3079856 RepID=UPI002912A74C|nr:phage holin family protein [Rhodophyticola sp. MJ-SS7]MDU8944627.1 phage holin family protein [Rhodophyticola sp. MJ-SS7]
MSDQADVNRGSSPVSDILTHLSNLMRKEVALARSEISQNIERAAMALGLLVAAVVMALTALNALAGAAIAGLASFGIEAGWASLIVGGVLALIAFLMLAKARHDLKISSLAPSRTAENVRRDADVIRGSLHD